MSKMKGELFAMVEMMRLGNALRTRVNCEAERAQRFQMHSHVL
jgi:hypothetical protein